MQGLRFNADGEIERTQVFIVYGSPASGKTTYVRKHMQPGDLVVDLDLLKQSISMADKTDASVRLLPIALAMRETLYQLIEQRQIDCDNVWVIGGLPNYDEREALRRRLDAELVFIEATKEQCIERAMNDPERKDKDIQVKVIEKWFKKYFYE